MDHKAHNQQLPSNKLAPTFSRMNSTKSEMSDKDFTDSSKTDSGCISDYCISTGSMSDLDIQHDSSKHLRSRHPLDSGLVSEENLESKDTSSHPILDSGCYSQEQFDSGCCEIQKRVSELDLQPLPSELDLEPLPSELDLELLPFKSDLLPLSYDEYWKKCYTPDDNGDLPLHIAVIHEKTEVVHHLVQVAPTAVCLDVRNDLSQTSLLLTVLTNQPHLTRHLILCNANYTKCDHYARTPLHWAVAEQNFECVEALTSPISKKELDAITGVRLEKRRSLLNETVNMTDSEGMTCVHLAAMTGNLKIMEHLIRNGGDVNTKEWKSGMSALHIAVERQDLVMVRFLLSQLCINVDIETYAGFTPYQICYDDNIRTMLEEAGAEKLPHAEDEHDMSMSETSEEEDEEEEMDDYRFQETNSMMAGMV